MANEEHVRRLLDEGVEAWNAWRNAEPDVRPDLSHANLIRANLSYANLRFADLNYANLRSANLRFAILSRAILSSTNLSDANLRSANLRSANLRFAILSDADLTGAHINRQTNFDDITVNGITKGLGPWVFNPEKYIIREIEFPPEYKQAGIGIMNYFTDVLHQKYPDISATVQITQEELTVRMTIETDDGHREIVEKTLEEYGLVVSGQRQPAELLPGPMDVLRLENQLAITQVQLDNERRLLLHTERQHSQRIESLEGEVTHLRQLVGDQLRHADRLADILELHAFAPLRSLLERGLTEADKADVQRILTEMGKDNPRTLQRIAEATAGSALGGLIGTNAALLGPWLQEVANNLEIVIRLAF